MYVCLRMSCHQSYRSFTNVIRVTIIYTVHFLDENTGYGTTAATLNVRERQKYERLFGSAMIQYRSLCIDKGIGEGEQYVCGPGIYEVYRSLAYMVTGPSNMKKGFWQKLVSHALIHFDVHTLFCLLCCYCMVICLHQFTCMHAGAFGKVYSGSMELEGTRRVVAIKTIKSEKVIIYMHTRLV